MRYDREIRKLKTKAAKYDKAYKEGKMDITEYMAKSGAIAHRIKNLKYRKAKQNPGNPLNAWTIFSYHNPKLADILLLGGAIGGLGGLGYGAYKLFKRGK